MTGWTGVLGLTRRVFSAPSFAIFTDLLTGWVLTPGRHTLTRMLSLGDPDSRRAHDAYHRFVRAGRWATAMLWRVLVLHAVSLCCPPGVIEVLVDDTVAHKSGRKVAGAGVFRDAVRSTKNKAVYAWGLNVVVVCLRVNPPWGGTPIALPVNLRIHLKGGQTTLELTADMVREIADWLPERSFHLTGDGAYASLLGAALPRTHVTSRIRRDAALFEPAPPHTGKPGRPATRGKKLPKPAELAATLVETDWQQGLIDERGRTVDRLVHIRDVLWYEVNPKELVRLTVVRDPAGTQPDDFFVTTDRHAAGADTAYRYAGRWPIECCDKDVKQHAGIEHPQSWRADGPARAVMLAPAPHRRLVLLPRELDEYPHLAAPPLVHPQGHPQLPRCPRRLAAYSLARPHFQRLVGQPDPGQNSQPPPRHTRGGHLAIIRKYKTSLLTEPDK